MTVHEVLLQSSRSHSLPHADGQLLLNIEVTRALPADGAPRQYSYALFRVAAALDELARRLESHGDAFTMSLRAQLADAAAQLASYNEALPPYEVLEDADAEQPSAGRARGGPHTAPNTPVDDA